MRGSMAADLRAEEGRSSRTRKTNFTDRASAKGGQNFSTLSEARRVAFETGNCDTDVASPLKLCQRHVSFTPCPISEGGKFKANTLPKGNAPDELGLATSSPGRSD